MQTAQQQQACKQSLAVKVPLIVSAPFVGGGGDGGSESLDTSCMNRSES